MLVSQQAGNIISQDACLTYAERPGNVWLLTIVRIVTFFLIQDAHHQQRLYV